MKTPPDRRITDLLESFAVSHDFKYSKTPVPYKPYGEVYGTYEVSSYFKLYIYATESRVMRMLDTVFFMTRPDIIPEGFCIDYQGDPFGRNRSLYERIKIRSYDESKVKQFIDDRVEAIITETLSRIDGLDEHVFKQRSSLRISDEGMKLSVPIIFQDIEKLDRTFKEVADAFSSLFANLV